MLEPGIADALRGAHTLAALEASRDAIVADLEVCEAMRDRAMLHRQLGIVLGRIHELRPPEHKADAIDEITERRSARRATARRSSRAKRPG